MRGAAPTPLAADRKLPLTRMRRAIGRAMSASAAIPQFTIERAVATTALADQRSQLDPEERVSLSDQLVAAVSRGLVLHPRLNATYLAEEKAILELAAINVGIAYAVDDGLISPPTRRSNELDLTQLARARHAAGKAVREGSVDAASLADVTFTISNLGPFGVDRFKALVVPPQAAILAIGAIDSKARMGLSLSCDHRVVDGAPGAEFLRDVAELLEDPAWMLRIAGTEAGPA
jgi:pyruvate dehydrogenase E2 component (dihydrolipoamide acetyltransferase)